MQTDRLRFWQETFGEVRYVMEAMQVPTAEQYIEVLERIEEDTPLLQKQILVQQFLSRDMAVCASELKALHQSHGVINRNYAFAAERFCKKMGYHPIMRKDDVRISEKHCLMNWSLEQNYSDDVLRITQGSDIRYWGVWSNGYERADRKFVWVMHPEVAYALQELQWVQKYGKKLQKQGAYWEGSTRFRVSQSYERSPQARRKCLEKYGYQCQVCDVHLEDIYGPAAAQVIHVHHRQLLSNGQGARFTDPYADLVPVCPNCHAVIHARTPEYEVDELRSILKQRKLTGS